MLNKGFAAVCLAASPQPIKLLKRFTSHYGSNSLDGKYHGEGPGVLESAVFSSDLQLLHCNWYD